MKKALLLVVFIALAKFSVLGQLIFDHGPLVNQPGAGSGGADVSSLHNSLNSFGFNVSLTTIPTNYRISDSFDIPTNQTWTIDSVIVYSYQTFSGNVSTTVSVSCAIYNGSPMTGGTIILGDETSNIMTTSYWSGIYRTNTGSFSNTDRPIMANRLVPSSTWSLTTGTYWLSFQVEGSSSFSGPW